MQYYYSYLLHITLEKSNAIRYILLYFLKKCNIITVTYYILLFRTFRKKTLKRIFLPQINEDISNLRLKVNDNNAY